MRNFHNVVPAGGVKVTNLPSGMSMEMDEDKAHGNRALQSPDGELLRSRALAERILQVEPTGRVYVLIGSDHVPPGS